MDNNNFFIEKSSIGVPDNNIGCKYHYTTIKALRGIISNNTLWVSNAMFLNDKSEVKYAVKFIEQQIRKNKKIANNVISVIEDYIYYIVDNSEQIFVLSASSNDDSQLLWSNYSRMDGYCLGFDFSKAWDKMYLRTNDKNSEVYKLNHKKQIRVDKVIYDRQEQKEFIKEPLLAINKFFKKNPDSDLKSFLHYFFHVLMMFKDPKFKDEEEYRFVFIIPEYEKFVQYYVANGILIPYIEIHFENKIPLENIIIGPRNNIDIAEVSINSFLKSKGYEGVKVTRSDIPLRY